MATMQFHPDGATPTGNWIFVFGSNLAGRHGKGAARVARTNFRAQPGVGRGRTGSAYAIPTKGLQLEILPLESIAVDVRDFIAHAEANPAENFFVTAIGTGYARYSDEEIGPLFADAPANCSLPMQWEAFTRRSKDTRREANRG